VASIEACRQRSVGGIEIPVGVVGREHQSIVQPWALFEQFEELRRPGRLFHGLGGQPEVLGKVFRGQPPQTRNLIAQLAPGRVEPRSADGDVSLPAVKVVERVSEAGAQASIEEARIIVAGGRGVGGPDGFGIVEQLAEALGGAVGATRAAVDSGWIPYSQQIGQTGKIVKPELYLALGISGAIQHKVGMRTSGAIVAVNRDPDAPIAEFADIFVVGDLFEVGTALLEQLRTRSG